MINSPNRATLILSLLTKLTNDNSLDDHPGVKAARHGDGCPADT
jgi:hypothetical protein